MRILGSELLSIALAGLAFAGAGAQESDKKPPRLCGCEQQKPGEVIEFIGIAFDAELTVDETGQGVVPRQASIFRIVSSPDKTLKTPVKVWHSTETAKCGVRFDYGKEYSVRARRDGELLETDYCLLKDVTQPAP